MNTVMRSVLSARHEKRAQRAHLLEEVQEENCLPNKLATFTSPTCHMTRNSSQLLAGGMQAKALLCRRPRLCFCGCE